MSTQLEQVLDLVSRIYDSALDPSLWPGTLTTYADIQSADAATLIARSPGDEAVDFAAAARINADLLQSYAEYYISRDVFLAASEKLPAGEIFLSPKHVPNPVLERSEFYTDFLAPDDRHYVMSPIMQGKEAGSWTLPIMRSKRRGDFETEQIKLADLLGPHFKRALQIQRVLAPAALAAQAHADALDCLWIGVALFNSRGQVIYLNRSAEAMLAMADGLSVVDGQLTASRRTETDKLNRLLEDTIHAGKDDLPTAGDPLSIPRPSGGPSFGLMVVPIRPQQPSIGHHLQDHVVKAAALISNPDDRSAAPLQALQSLFGLTRAEAAVCRELIGGSSVTGAAVRLGVKAPTVRRHLEHIFEKTGTHRQAELVALLLSSIVTYANPDK